MADNKDDMSLDDILTSIRSVVMDEEKEDKKQQKQKQPEQPEPKNEQVQKENIDNIENAIFSSDEPQPQQAPEPTGQAEEEIPIVEPQQNAEESLIQQAQGGISETLPTNDGTPQGVDLTDEERMAPTEADPTDTAPSQLSDIMELGDTSAKAPMVSGKSAFDVEESIKEIIEILNKNKDQLPPEFFEKQDEVIKTWLNGHLPDLVEKVVQGEISRIFKYVYKNK